MHNYTSGFKLMRATAATGDESAPSHVSLTKPSNVFEIGGARAARIRFFGTDAASEASTVNIWLVDLNKAAGPSEGPTTYYSYHLCTCAIILGTAVGAAGCDVGASQFLADGCALTEVGSVSLDPIQGASTAVYTSTANDWGELTITNMGGAYGLIHVCTTLNTAASQSAVISLCEF